MAKCNRCNGSKYCDICKGKGYDSSAFVARDCRTCASTGKCPKCGGSGES